MNSVRFFPVGATYAPLAKATEVEIGEWDRDLAVMASLGLNTFRLFIAWDRIETTRGVRDFSRVDHAFELAQRHGLRVIVNVGGTFANLQAIYPPRWLYTECGCQEVKPTPDAPERINSPRLKLCYDDPCYQREAMGFIAEAVRRYRSHPALLAWSGWNEPRVATCFCPHTLALYRQWLRERYSSLDRLIAAWSTEFPLYYHDWKDIHPQLETGFEHGGYTAWQDWQTFCRVNRTDKFRMIARAIRSEDPEHPVLSHLCHAGDADIFDSEDIGGTSIYTYFRRRDERWEEPDADLARVLNWNSVLMGTGYRRDRREPDSFWIMETEAGPVSWVHGLMPRTYSGRKMNARDMIFVGNGARCLLRWLYRSRISDAQAGEFNLVAWDGSVTDRAADFGALAHFLNTNAELFLTNTPPDSGIGILCNNETEKILQGAEEISRKYGEAAERWHSCLSHCGYAAEVCNDRQAEEGWLKRYRVLIVPFRPYVGAEMAERLEKFVAEGGLLITEAPFATKDMKAIHWLRTPGGGLDRVFGAQVYDLEKLLEPDCGPVPGYDFKALIRPDGCEVEGVFADGRPALISHRYGRGRAVMFGSLVSMPYGWDTGARLRRCLTGFLSGHGLTPWAEVETENAARIPDVAVLFRALPTEGRLLVTVVNFSREANPVMLRLPGADRIAAVGGSDPETVPAIAADTVKIPFLPFGWAVFTIIHHDKDGKAK